MEDGCLKNSKEGQPFYSHQVFMCQPARCFKRREDLVCGGGD